MPEIRRRRASPLGRPGSTRLAATSRAQRISAIAREGARSKAASSAGATPAITSADGTSRSGPGPSQAARPGRPDAAERRH